MLFGLRLRKDTDNTPVQLLQMYIIHTSLFTFCLNLLDSLNLAHYTIDCKLVTCLILNLILK